MAVRRAFHQLDPKTFGERALDKMEFREDVKGERYEEGKVYRSRNYPNEYFTWHPFDASQRKLPGNEGVKGEWRMGALSEE
jgi:hypothetical protein